MPAHMNKKFREQVGKRIIKPYINWIDKLTAERFKEAKLREKANEDADIKDYSTSKNKTAKEKVAIVLKAVVSAPRYALDREFRKQMIHLRRSLGIKRDNAISSLIHEISDGDEVSLRYNELVNKSKQHLDSAAEEMYKNTARMVQDHLEADGIKPTEEEWVHLTEALLNTDTQTLLQSNHYSPKDIIDVLRSNQETQERIRKTQRALKAAHPGAYNYFRVQAKSLGIYMATGESNTRLQLRNVDNIVEFRGLANKPVFDGSSKSNPKPTADAATIRQLVDELATLHAIKHTPQTARDTSANFMETAYTNMALSDGDHNGIKTLLNLHTASIQNAKDNEFAGAEVSQIKGFTTEHFDSAVSIEFSKHANDRELLTQGYKRVANGKLSKDVRDSAGIGTGDGTGDNTYMYISYNNMLRKYHSGAISLADNNTKGRKAKIDPFAKEAKVTMEQIIKEGINTTKSWAVPVFSTTNPNKVKSFQYVMSRKNKKKYLRMANPAHATMGRMFARGITKRVSKEINNEVVTQLMSDYYDKATKKEREGDYIEISRYSEYPRGREIYKMLPKHTRITIQEHNLERGIYDDNGRPSTAMYVRANEIDTLFGYRAASLTDAVFNLKNRNRKYSAEEKTRIEVAKALNIPIYDKNNINKGMVPRMLKLGGRIWQQVVARNKAVVVLYTPAVLTGNIVSNFFVGKLNNVPYLYSLKHQSKAVKYLNDYTRDRNTLVRLRHRYNINKTSANLKALHKMQTKLDDSPIKPLIDAGLFQSIVEDVVINDTPLRTTLEANMPKVVETADKISDVMPEIVKDVVGNAFITETSYVGKFLTKATQYSDFVARYATYKHLTEEQGMSHKDAIARVRNDYVDYVVNTSKEMQWANDMGILPYTKFSARIQKVLWRTHTENPLNAAAIQGLQLLFGNVSDIYDANLLGQIRMSRFGSVDDIIDQSTKMALGNYIPFYDNDLSIDL